VGQHGVVVVRRAVAEDFDALAAVHVRCWQQTYRGHFPQDYLDALDQAARAAGYRDRFRDGPEPGGAFLVSTMADDIVGFINVGPSRDSDQPEAGEVRAVYLLTEFWDRGLGRELMTAGLEVLAGAGFAATTLWVLEGNRRARRFYERGGWTPDGSVKQDESLGFVIREVRLRRSLPTGC
jgi:ribosomal protein S18 acetylase RimI-like enzyme